MILTPAGNALFPAFPSRVNQTSTRTGDACPRDPYHYQEGEAGYYNDSPLGAVPNDFQLAPVYGYTPVNEGWTKTNQGLVPGGINVGFAGYPLRAPRSLGDSASDQAAIDAYNSKKRSDWLFKLSIASTVAVGISALLGIYRHSAGIKQHKY